MQHHEITRLIQHYLPSSAEYAHMLQYNLERFADGLSAGTFILCQLHQVYGHPHQAGVDFCRALNLRYADWNFTHHVGDTYLTLHKECVSLDCMSLSDRQGSRGGVGYEDDDEDMTRPHFMHQRADVAAILGRLHSRLGALEAAAQEAERSGSTADSGHSRQQLRA